MNHLIVYTHPNPASFNHAIMEAYALELEATGRDVRIRDLYSMGFDPVIKQSDYDMMAKGEMPADIRAEQEHIRWADVITFIFPIFWAGLPALLKGYIDKVFSLDFAYTFKKGRPKGLLKGKRVVIINTTGGSLKLHQSSGMFESISQTIDGGIFKYCGMKVVEHRFFMSVPTSTEDERSEMLEDVRRIARSL